MHEATSDAYVTRSTWVRPMGRGDLVDEIADEFERPTSSAASDSVRWPRRSRGWRGDNRLRLAELEHRAAG